MFLEHWADKEALGAHFKVPASHDFVTAVTALAASPPTIEIYEAEPARLCHQSAKTSRLSWMKNVWSWPLFGSVELYLVIVDCRRERAPRSRSRRPGTRRVGSSAVHDVHSSRFT